MAKATPLMATVELKLDLTDAISKLRETARLLNEMADKLEEKEIQ